MYSHPAVEGPFRKKRSLLDSLEFCLYFVAMLGAIPALYLFNETSWLGWGILFVLVPALLAVLIESFRAAHKERTMKGALFAMFLVVLSFVFSQQFVQQFAGGMA